MSNYLMSYSTKVAKARWQTISRPEDPDFALVDRIARQEEGALEALYQRYASRLLAYLIGRVRDPRLAEEVLQDVMLAAWRNAPRFRGECRVYTWLLILARSRAINAYHRQIAPASLEVSLEDPDLDRNDKGSWPVETAARYRDLQTAIELLPEEQRETLELVFYHGLSQQETAFVLKIAPGTVKSRLHRAKTRLRKFLIDESEPDESPS